MKRLTIAFREQHSSVRWKEWAGLRDVLVHAYDVIDDQQLWDYAQTDVPRLLDFLAAFDLDWAPGTRKAPAGCRGLLI